MACINPHYSKKIRDWRGQPVMIECGVCGNCRAKKISSVVARANYAWKNNKDCAYCTFTIDDNHLPFFRNSYSIKPSVSKKIWHKFNDNLRHYVKNHNIKGCSPDFQYLSCGEYGTEKGSERPHYHAIFFGLSHKSISYIVKRIWEHGFVEIEPVDNGAIRYVCKYLEKSTNGDFSDSLYFDKGIEPPFVVYSKGLGSGLFESQKDNINKYGCMIINNQRIPVSNYYKNKYFVFDDKKLWNIEADSHRLKMNNKSLALQFGFNSVTAYFQYQSLLKDKQRLVKQRDLRKSFSMLELDDVDKKLSRLKLHKYFIIDRRFKSCPLPV